MTFLTLVPPLQENVVQYGADPTGATDSTNAILAAYSAASGTRGAGIGYPPGLFIVSAPLTPYTNNDSNGAGAGSTIIQASNSFSGVAIFNLSNVSFCNIRNMTIQGPNSSYSSNPAADAIDITGCTDVVIEKCYFNYINGWAINSTSTSGTGNTHITFKDIYTHLCAYGIQVLGVSGSGEVGTHKFENTTVSGTQVGDCYLIQDIHDILGNKMYGECSAGSGSVFNLKGALAVDITTFDIGPYPGPSTGPVILIHSSSNGPCKNVNISNGTIEGGSVGVQINSGSWITINNCKIFNNNTAGVNIADPAECRIINCMFDQNGSVAGTGRYEIVNASTGDVFYQGNKFMTPQGNTAGSVNSCINDTGTNSCYNANYHDPNGGWNTGNIFASGNAPHIYQNVLGLTAQGIISTTTPGGSPYTINGVAYPRVVYVSGGTVSGITLGGTSTGRTSGDFYLPPHTPLAITYTAAPTVVVSTVST